MIASKDLQQEAYKRIDNMNDEDIRLIISLIDKIQHHTNVDDVSEKKRKISEMAGKFDFDEEAINDLRMRSMI